MGRFINDFLIKQPSFSMFSLSPITSGFLMSPSNTLQFRVYAIENWPFIGTYPQIYSQLGSFNVDSLYTNQSELKLYA